MMHRFLAILTGLVLSLLTLITAPQVAQAIQQESYSQTQQVDQTDQQADYSQDQKDYSDYSYTPNQSNPGAAQPDPTAQNQVQSQQSNQTGRQND